MWTAVADANIPTNLGVVLSTNITRVAHSSGKFYGRVLLPSGSPLGTGMIRVGDTFFVHGNSSGAALNYDNPRAIVSSVNDIAGTFDYELKADPVTATITSQEVYLRTRFKMAILSGVKAGKTANSGSVFFQLVSGGFLFNPTSLYPIKITAGNSFVLEARDGHEFELSNIYFSTDTNADGITAAYF